MDMESRAMVVGKSKRQWTDKATGEVKQYKEMHVIYEKPPKDDAFEGQRVEVLRMPDSTPYGSVRVGATYDIDFEARNTRNGVMLVVTGVQYVDLSVA